MKKNNMDSRKKPIPQNFEEILKDFTKAIEKKKPKDIIDFGCEYFAALEEGESLDYKDKDPNEIKKNPSKKEILEEEDPVASKGLFRRTKIICTLGPAVDDAKILERIIKLGLNAARFNFSHGSHQEHFERLTRFRTVCKKLGKYIPTILDTKGPEIRLGKFSQKCTLKKDQMFTLTTKDCIGNEKIASVSHKGFAKDLQIGNKVLIDDGLIELEVVEKTETDVTCKVLNAGDINSNKGINLPSVRVSLPSLTDKDRDDLKFGVDNKFDYVAASFIKSKDDVLAIRQCLDSYNGQFIKIISKIENQEGLDNYDSILEVSDGIMVARGDLGVEIPFERIPIVQKMMIRKAVDAGKLVITATQLLDSMINNPRATRAEANDVSNAVIDRTTCVMLSGETAAGKYPIEAVKTMSKICAETETHVDYDDKMTDLYNKYKNSDLSNPEIKKKCYNISIAITAMVMQVKAIICITRNGKSAKILSGCRPKQPILIITPFEDTARVMSIYWGIASVVVKGDNLSEDEILEKGKEELIKLGFLQKGWKCILSGGASRLEEHSSDKTIGGLITI